MDVNQIYFNSPDWIKAMLILAPFVTAYAIARLALKRKPAAKGEALYEPPLPHAVTLNNPRSGVTEPLPLDWELLDHHFMEARMKAYSDHDPAIDPALVRWIGEKHDEIVTRMKPDQT